jgi:hypothetical protein
MCPARILGAHATFPQVTNTPRQRFVLEAIDPETNCIAIELTFAIDDLSKLTKLLDIEPRSFEPHTSYPIEPDDLDALIREFDLNFAAGSMEVRLRSWFHLDGLPYKIHTDRELLLMLSGTKPLAVFSDDTAAEFFAPHVASGKFVKREHTCAFRAEGPLRHVFYALPEEAWRINAYILIWETAKKAGFGEWFERMEGALLGYEPWQIDASIETIYRAQVGPDLKND